MENRENIWQLTATLAGSRGRHQQISAWRGLHSGTASEPFSADRIAELKKEIGVRI